MSATPTGTLVVTENLYIEGAPYIYFGGELQYAPDANGYYWGITGTAANPVHKVGCFENLQWSENSSNNDIQCDTIGVVASIARRNYLELSFDMKSFLPLEQLKIMLRWTSYLSVPGEDIEYAGIGEINQNDFHNIYLSKTYDTNTNDYISITATRCQFFWNGQIQFRYGDPWMVGVILRMYANDDLPADQRFATVVRYDPSAI
jgi:hypothetical protein